MALSPENRNRLLNATKESAAAFMEDLKHLRELSPKADRAILRRASGVLRRLLIDGGGDFGAIAAPRIGKFKLVAPDNNIIYHLERKSPHLFFISGAANCFGITMRALLFESGRPRKVRETGPGKFDPDQNVELTMDGFLGQRVLCLQGKWARRKDVIKYVANTASGVHSGSAKEAVDILLSQIRNCVSLSPKTGVRINLQAMTAPDPAFVYSPDSIDPVLFELLSAAMYFLNSPDIALLERELRREFGIDDPKPDSPSIA